MKEIIPGEWQTEVDQWGAVRRYRMIGNCKEYEGTVRIDGLEVPESQLEAFHKSRTEAKEKELHRPRPETISATVKRCPFMSGYNTARRADCVFRAGTRCALCRPRTADTRDTAGAFCPFCGTCKASCAMYDGGCTLK